ncbi:hypothetical protein V6N13_108046 [Hibiscus sabdariffa]
MSLKQPSEDGSSNGYVVRVSSRLCHVDLGVDIGGFVRMLASLGGVVGFKPIFGCISHSKIGWDVQVALRVCGASHEKEYLKAQQMRYCQMHIYNNIFAIVDVIVTPTTGWAIYLITDDAQMTSKVNCLNVLSLMIFYVGQRPCICLDVDPQWSFQSQIIKTIFIWQFCSYFKGFCAFWNVTLYYSNVEYDLAAYSVFVKCFCLQ